MSGAGNGDGRAYLSVCAIYRDEARYLREWVEFHRLVGVERFFLYDNRSEDDHREVLAPYLEEGTVVIHDWPLFPAQVEAYDHCLLEHAQDSRWIAFIDLDEFLFSPTGRPLPELLPDYERFSAVGVNWALFGTSGHLTPPPGLVIESYTMRMEVLNRQVKSIVRPETALSCEGPHSFLYREGFAVDELQRPLEGGRLVETPTLERLRINHYMTRSEAELEKKRSNQGADDTKRRWPQAMDSQMLRGSIEDDVILRYLPALRESLAARAAAQHRG